MLEGLLVHTGARTEFEPYTDPAQTGERVDLRDLLSFTIDPETAKDFDDAISVRGERRRLPRRGSTSRTSRRTSQAGIAARPRRGRARLHDVRARTGGVDAAAAARRTTVAACARTRTGCASPSRLPPSGEPLFYRSVIRSRARLTYAQAERREAEPDVAAALERTDRLTAAHPRQALRPWRAQDREPRGQLRVRRPRQRRACLEGVGADRPSAGRRADDRGERGRRAAALVPPARNALPRRTSGPIRRRSSCC